MDRDLLRQSLSYHGQSLYSFLKCEQNENPDFKLIAAELSKAPIQRRDKSADSASVEQFIARKADLLFAHSWKSNKPAEEEWPEEAEEPYAVMPPLEQFLDIPFDERRGPILQGRLERDIEDLELTALCPIRDVPSNGNHDDPLSYYHVGDLIRAGVKDIDRYHGKLSVSLHTSSLSPHLAKLKLGVISKEDMPLHYIRGVKVANSGTDTYEKVLEDSLGFSNPSNVDFLLKKLGVSETQPPSLMRGLQSKCFLDGDYGTSIRKKQSASWALKCVKIGVDHFKSRRHVDAMNEYNKALEIDTNNVEALVARGALYATKGSLSKAMDDFQLALDGCPTHRNAKKYLCQTLVERGGQLEEEEKLVTAEGLYKKALALDETFQEAEEALKKLQLHIQKSLKLREEEMAKEERESKCVETSAEKLRKILKEEKRMKRKRRRSSSSSSTSSNSSSSSSSSSSASSSSSRRKSKKRRRKHRRTSSSRKKRHHRVSSRDDRSIDGKEECYPAPANTSASFLSQKQEVAKLLGERERSEDRSRLHAKGRRSRLSASSPSVEIADDGRGRFDDDPFIGSGESTGAKDWCEDFRHLASPWSHDGRPGERRLSGREKEEAGVQRRPSTRSDWPAKEYPAQGGSRRGSDGSRCEHPSSADGKMESARTSDRNERALSGDGRSRNGQGTSGENSKKGLPTNLLDIFSQIAEFEKEKCMKVKK
ncbi:hypothetical protein SKAU_G00048820 [Synaphobranchus kaupii]|uniref:Tetratricopeptide repeat protein 14 n=1 Tax=Synaphobranchus kaupii TaxID=118154 RepID=A0A9Q1G2L6_SYNKA|nr:hypothetical protein SKAU_G00048820 [Synaphobranchus kaupii]